MVPAEAGRGSSPPELENGQGILTLAGDGPAAGSGSPAGGWTRPARCGCLCASMTSWPTSASLAGTSRPSARLLSPECLQGNQPETEFFRYYGHSISIQRGRSVTLRHERRPGRQAPAIRAQLRAKIGCLP